MTTAQEANEANETSGCRIYSFPARIHKADRGRAHDILRLGHKYRNQWVEIERKRRKAVDKLVAQLDPEVAELETEIDKAELDLEATRLKIKKNNSQQRRRKASAEDAGHYEEAKKALENLYALRKAARARVFKTEVFKEQSRPLEAAAIVARKAARKQIVADGLHWGSYTQIEQARKKDRTGRPPKFKRFEGFGKVAVQFQGGATVQELTSDQDTRLQVSWDGHEVTTSQKCPWRHGKIRVGSDANRKPEWLGFDVRLSRPLPEGCLVKWAWLVAQRVGTTTKWYLQFSIHLAETTPKPHLAGSKGLVAIDVGWRRRPNGDLRIAYWRGDDGAEGEVVIPQSRVTGYRKADSIQSIRQQLFNQTKDTLVAWIKKQRDTIPEWFNKETQYIHTWAAQARLAALILRWKDRRFSGDEQIFDILNRDRDAWRKRDKHLLQWEAFQRFNYQNWRKNYYRDIARELASKYRHVVIEDVNWTHIAQREDCLTEEAEYERQQKLGWKDEAAVSHFNAACNMMFGTVRRTEANRTTMDCHECGETCKFDPKILHHTCEHCGARWDQDANAARNILMRHNGKAVMA